MAVFLKKFELFMINFRSPFLWILLLLTSFSVQAQNSDSLSLERWVKNGEIDSLFSFLKEKKQHQSLSHREYSLLIYSSQALSQYKDGLAYTYEWENYILKKEDSAMLAKPKKYRMKILYYLGEKEKAVLIGEDLLKYFETIKNEKQMIDTQLSLGLFYREVGEPEKAEKLYLSIPQEKLRKNQLISFYNNLGTVYRDQNEFQKSLTYMLKSLALGKELKLTDELALFYNNIGSAYIDVERPHLSLKYLDSAYHSLTNYNNLIHKKLIFQNKYTAWNKLGNTDSTFHYLEELRAVDEENYHIRLNTETESLKAAFQKEKQMQSIIDETHLEIEKNKRTQLYFYIIGLVGLLVVSLIFYFYRLQKIQAEQKEIKIEQQLLRLQLTPHFLFNSLSVIQGMILHGEKDNAVSYVSKLSKLLRLVLKNSRSQWVELSTEIEGIQHYIDLQNLRTQHKIKYHIDTENNTKEKDVLVPPMFIQPYIENAIIHGFKEEQESQELNMQIIINQGICICIINDNGIGIDIEAQHNNTSLSGKINNERLQLIFKETGKQGKIEITNLKETGKQGTQVKLHIPYKKIKE